MTPEFIVPEWPAPASVVALQTTRRGGVSRGVYAGLNLGDHVGDEESAVHANRAAVIAFLPGQPLWLRQVHGLAVADAESAQSGVEADAAVARSAGRVCAVMTADCLPLLFCDRAGTVVAAVHAGWRGLCAGVIEQTVAAMNRGGDQLLVWLGPAIGAQAFEVGSEVRAAFVTQDVAAAAAFVEAENGKYLADIYQLARQRLSKLGVTAIYGGNLCTVSDSDRFFSYRRDGVTGRMATFIGLAASNV